MTFQEIEKKWSARHLNAFLDVICFIEPGKTELIVPSAKYHSGVTDQIFSDFGFSPVKVRRINGKKPFHKYVKRTTRKE